MYERNGGYTRSDRNEHIHASCYFFNPKRTDRDRNDNTVSLWNVEYYAGCGKRSNIQALKR